MVAYCVWLSVDPVRKKIDYYPRKFALRIEKRFQETKLLPSGSCVLGNEFYNSTIHFNYDGSKYQTTPGMSLGRVGFKQPGYRSVKRVILNDEDTKIEIYSKEVFGEWRITSLNDDYEHVFEEHVSNEYKIEIDSKDLETEKILIWNLDDLESCSVTKKNVIVWQWCCGTLENQGNLFKLSNDWFIPYNCDITENIETAFNNCTSTQIDLPVIGKRNIEFMEDSCFAKQKSLDDSSIRLMRRIVTTVEELKLMFDSISKVPINIEEILANLPDGVIPSYFNCSILQDIMNDPVKTIDGHVYQRSAIERWFEHNTTSPLTGLRLKSTILESDFKLKKQIDDFLSLLVKKRNS